MAIKTLYGHFSEEQFNEHMKYLQKKLFWLLLYKDPKYQNKWNYVEVDRYIKNLLFSLDGLNQVLEYPEPMVRLMGSLQEVYYEAIKTPFNWPKYRSLVFQAFDSVDELIKVKKGG